LYDIAKLFMTEDQDTKLRRMFTEGGVGYGDIKHYVAEIINEYLRPMREKRKELIQDPEYLKQVIKEGGEKASIIANKKMDEVRKKVGLIL